MRPCQCFSTSSCRKYYYYYSLYLGKDEMEYISGCQKQRHFLKLYPFYDCQSLRKYILLRKRTYTYIHTGCSKKNFLSQHERCYHLGTLSKFNRSLPLHCHIWGSSQLYYTLLLEQVLCSACMQYQRFSLFRKKRFMHDEMLFLLKFKM